MDNKITFETIEEYLGYIKSFCPYCQEGAPCLRHRAVLRLLMGEPIFTVKCQNYYILLPLDDYEGKLIPYRYNSTAKSYEFIKKVRPYGDINTYLAEFPMITLGSKRYFTKELCNLLVIDAREPHISKTVVKRRKNIFVFSHNKGLKWGFVFPFDFNDGITLESKLCFEELKENEPILLNWNRYHLDAIIKIRNAVIYFDILNHETYPRVLEVVEEGHQFEVVKDAVERVIKKAKEESTETVKGEIVSVWDYVLE